MNNIEDLIKTAVGEMERLLNARTVVGEPITHGDTTIVPLTSVGFGFGVGSGFGASTSSDSGDGSGIGVGGGGGIKPVAVVMIEKDTVRLENIKGSTVTVAEKVVDLVDKVATNKLKADEQATDENTESKPASSKAKPRKPASKAPTRARSSSRSKGD